MLWSLTEFMDKVESLCSDTSSSAAEARLSGVDLGSSELIGVAHICLRVRLCVCTCVYVYLFVGIFMCIC